LRYLRCDNTDISFNNTFAWTASSATMYLRDNLWTSPEVNNAIASLKTCTDCIIQVDGTNAHRTAASNDDLNTLLANGNTASLNDVLGSEMITDGNMSADTNWDVSAASWSIAVGVASYDDVNDGQGIFQTDGNMAGNIETETTYRISFKIVNAVSNAIAKISNAANDVDYLAQDDYDNNTHVRYFKTPAALSGAGIGIVAYQSGDSFDLDNVSLKKVTFP